MIIDKNVEVDCPCPECGYKRKFKLKDLEENTEYVCGGCKKTINLEGSKFIKDLEKGLNNAKTSIKDTIKNLNRK
jgi:DNA-directed RNA polymerase subunit RPC12/RpoP